MAEFRTVYTKMWREDEWFQNLDAEAKLFFIYLFTNPSASVAGIYRLPVRTMAFETGLSNDAVTTLLRDFTQAGKIDYQDGVIWVHKMREYQLPGRLSPKVLVRINKDIESIPYGTVKNKYLQHYGYPIDTVSIPNSTVTVTVTDTVTVTETVKAKTAPAPKKAPKKEHNENCDHPAVIAYRDICKLTPNDTQRQLIVDSVTDLETWRESVKTWVASGWKPSNVQGMIDRYKAPAPAQTNGRSNGYGPKPFTGSIASEANRAFNESVKPADRTPRRRPASDGSGTTVPDVQGAAGSVEGNAGNRT